MDGYIIVFRHASGQRNLAALQNSHDNVVCFRLKSFEIITQIRQNMLIGNKTRFDKPWQGFISVNLPIFSAIGLALIVPRSGY